MTDDPRNECVRTRVLLVEDDVEYAQAARKAFSDAHEGVYLLEVSNGLNAARESIAACRPDVVIAGATLSDGLGKELIRTTDDLSQFPVVVIFDPDNEPLAADAVRAGASASVAKSAATVTDLPEVVRSALSDWRYIRIILALEHQLHLQEQQSRTILDAVSDLVLVISPTGDLHDCGGDFRRFGVDDPALLVGKNLADLMRGQLRDSLIRILSEAEHCDAQHSIPIEITLADSRRYVEARVVPLSSNRMLAILRDATETMMSAVTLQSLTRSEQDVLGLVTEGKSNKQVAHELGITLKAVETRRARIMRKLDVQNLVELMRLVLTGRRLSDKHGSQSPA